MYKMGLQEYRSNSKNLGRNGATRNVGRMLGDAVHFQTTLSSLVIVDGNVVKNVPNYKVCGSRMLRLCRRRRREHCKSQ